MDCRFTIPESKEKLWRTFVDIKEAPNIKNQIMNLVDGHVRSQRFISSPKIITHYELISPKALNLLFLLEDLSIEEIMVRLSSYRNTIKAAVRKLSSRGLIRKAKEQEVSRSGYFLSDKGKSVRSAYALVAVDLIKTGGKTEKHK